jgi:hypothetical protein
MQRFGFHAAKRRLLALSLGGILVNGASRSEGVKSECKRDVVGNVSQIAALLPLHDHVPNIPAAGDGMTVERGRLSRLPFENQLALPPQQKAWLNSLNYITITAIFAGGCQTMGA